MRARVVSALIVFLLLLLLVFRLSLGHSIGFYVVATCDATLIFITFIWLLVHLALDSDATLGAKKIKFAAITLVAFLVTLIVLLSVRVGVSTTFFLVAAIDAAIALGFFSWVLVRKVKSRRIRQNVERQLVLDEDEVSIEQSYLQQLAGLPTRFRYEELEAATNDFQTLIGRGGSGSVFKGTLADGSPVAVKRIEGAVRGDKEFRTEITAIASIQHINLVRLLGYCLVRGGHRFLVYEFIERGSLDSWIFPRRDGGEDMCLPWALRYQVAVQVAKALAYLHHDCRLRILHLDVKPENILLDDNFHAHVSDFGISKLMGRDEGTVVTTVRGTRGYLAPEWFSGEGISEKSDVYSYGMVLLELLGGRRNVRFVNEGSDSQRRWSYFPKIVSGKMREEKVMEAVDERLLKDGTIEEKEVRVLVHVALWCIQEKAELRPSMALVVDMLEGHVPVSMPPETKMFLVDLVLSADSETSDGSFVRSQSASAAEIENPLMPSLPFSVSTMGR